MPDFYTLTVVEPPGHTPDFTTHLFLSEEQARRYCFSAWGIEPTQLVIGETLAYAGGVWYDLDQVDSGGVDVTVVIRVDMHRLPGTR